MEILSIVDLEMTGLGKFDIANPVDDDYPVSIGIILAGVDEESKVIRCLDSFHTLIRIPNPSKVEETSIFHHIFPEDLEAAPKPKEVCGQIRKFYEKYGEIPAGAWNHKVDRHFVDILFKMGKMESPMRKWVELQPERMASLEKYVAQYVQDPAILGLDAHDALNDCIRTIGVMAALKNYGLDMSGLEMVNS
ncbi:exonuclease domain-containing protein [Methanocella sp. MCL-LM]|uniref:3'-5' exonuclease n=1 Tax=Methanocella sp. MCL-LM TaxID=3412035 RepID=UPI003C76FE97